jgi:pyruvate dehydrogenase E2 component (dihydrolipoamide acetyltransferase)
MATPVKAPQLGNTVEECLITKWYKRKGEAVSAGEAVAEIETDKAAFEVTAPVSGTVLERFFEEGALVPVFTNLLVIGEPGEDIDAFRPAAAAAAPAAVHSLTVETQNPGSEPRPSGPFSPRARRFAEKQDFHPASIIGSGPGGRVLEQDMRREYDARRRTTPSEQAGVSGLRERIARRLRESLASTAQYTLHASADAGGLRALRARIKASSETPDININHLITFCTIRALLDMPELNAAFLGGSIHKHEEIHIGFACDTPRGLLVPVIREAHRLTARQLAAQMRELTARAVQGSVSPDDLSGATFTISNLGSLGIESFTPILNPPQVAILGVGAIQLRPVRRHRKVEFIDSVGLSLTCDHQVIDGAPGARFLQVLREKIENVESICMIGS